MSCGSFHKPKRVSLNFYRSAEEADHQDFRIDGGLHPQEIDVPAGSILEKPPDVAVHDKTSHVRPNAVKAAALARFVIVRIKVDDEGELLLVRRKSRQSKVNKDPVVPVDLVWPTHRGQQGMIHASSRLN